MHHFIDFALAQVPSVYRRLVTLRGTPNLEKVVFLTLVRKGDVVFDIGAHTGYYTRLFSNLVGGRGEVHAFEPMADSFLELDRQVALGCRHGNVRLHNVALADHPGAGEMVEPDGDLAQASLLQHSSGSWQQSPRIHRHPCTIDTVDDHAERYGLARLDFVKCDVEGAELLVLRGASRTLRRFQPLLHLEVFAPWMRDFGMQPGDLRRWLEGLGYTDFMLLSEFGRLLAADLELLSSESTESANLVCATAKDASRLGRLRSRLKA